MPRDGNVKKSSACKRVTRGISGYIRTERHRD